MDLIRCIALGYAVVLRLRRAPQLHPGPHRRPGTGVRHLRARHLRRPAAPGSAAWAAVSAYWSRQASVNFLKLFGTLYFLDGLLGLATGSGYLDLGILLYGVQNLPLGFKILANLPHIALGGFAIFCGLRSCRATRVCRMSPAPRPLLRRLRYPLLGLAVLVVLAAIADPLRRRPPARAGAEPRPLAFRSVLEPAHRREEINSYLTYPEWSIVHAYEDLAGVMRQGSESDFAYFGSVAQLLVEPVQHHPAGLEPRPDLARVQGHALHHRPQLRRRDGSQRRSTSSPSAASRPGSEGPSARPRTSSRLPSPTTMPPS